MNGKSKYEDYKEFRRARAAHKAVRKQEALDLKKSRKHEGKKSLKFDPRFDIE